MKIRVANMEDAEAIRKIYAPYVSDTAVSFEYEVPSVNEFKQRMQKTLEEYPYLVATLDDEDNAANHPEIIVGYAYASAFHVREAYKHTAELSIYVDQDYRKKGIGRELYNKLQELLVRQNVYTVYACIASPEEEDIYLTKDSERFHEKTGFKLVGKHELCGYKFERWYSMIWMEKQISEKPEKVTAFIPFNQDMYL